MDDLGKEPIKLSEAEKRVADIINNIDELERDASYQPNTPRYVDFSVSNCDAKVRLYPYIGRMASSIKLKGRLKFGFLNALEGYNEETSPACDAYLLWYLADKIKNSKYWEINEYCDDEPEDKLNDRADFMRKVDDVLGIKFITPEFTSATLPVVAQNPVLEGELITANEANAQQQVQNWIGTVGNFLNRHL